MIEIVSFISAITETGNLIGKLFGKGRITGRILDENNQPIPNAIISINNNQYTSTLTGSFLIEKIKGKCIVDITYNNITRENVEVIYVGSGETVNVIIQINKKSLFDDVKKIESIDFDNSIKDKVVNMSKRDKIKIENENIFHDEIDKAKKINEKSVCVSDSNNRFAFFNELLNICNQKTDICKSISSQNHSSFLEIRRLSNKKIWFQFIANKTNSRLELYLQHENNDINKKWFNELNNQKQKIEEELGFHLKWDYKENRRCQIIQSLPINGGVDNFDNWKLIHETLAEKLIAFERVFPKYIENFKE